MLSPEVLRVAREIRVDVRVGGKLLKTFRVPVREPRVEASLQVDGVPESLPPGIKAPVKIVVTDKNSELPSVDYMLCPDHSFRETCVKLTLHSGDSTTYVHSYGFGKHEVVLKFGGKVIVSTEFVIGEEPLRVRVEPASALSLTYPDGGVLEFRVSEARSAPFTVTGAHADLGDLGDCEVEVSEGSGDAYVVSVRVRRLRRPVKEAKLRLGLVVRDALGRELRVSGEFSIVVEVSREFLDTLYSRVESLASEAESLASSGDLVRALIKAGEAVATCASGEPFMECGEVRELPAKLLLGRSVAEAYLAVKDALRVASEDVKRFLAPLLARLEGDLSEGLGKVSDALSRFSKSFEVRKFGDALSAAEEAVRMCEELGVSGSLAGRFKECSEALEAVRRVGRLKEFLQRDVAVRIPARTRLGWFKVGVMVRNRSGEELTGVYIDFGPAKHYLELPEERIVLPPLYPGMEIAREVKVRSLFTGTIVIPYRVCLGDLCVDKRGRVVVGGRLGAEALTPTLAGAEVLTGKGVPGLEALGLGPRQAQSLPTSVRVGEYVCTHLLGSGGFSVTLLCSKSGMNAVLKVPPEAYWILLSGGSPDVDTLDLRDELLRAFDREARVLRELRHPNVVRLLEYSVNPFPYLAFEYCELGELRRVLSTVPRLKPKVALEIMIPVTAAVAHAHAREKPIVHMDIKPENILLTRDYVPKLTDFNIAKIIGTVSRTSAGKGYTQGYAAPEQLGLEGYPPPHTYTDVFALGVVLYELITGVKPYPIETYQRNFRNPPTPKPPSQLNPETPRDLDDILNIALQPNPDDRYRDATQLLNDLWDTYQQHYYE